MGINRKKYESDILSKRNYNSKLSTFQIDKNIHNLVKEYCELNNLKVKDFLESVILDKINS